MMSLMAIWFDFIVNQWLGLELTILVSIFLFYITLLMGRVSFQMQLQILLPAIIYFTTMLWPTPVVLFLSIILAVVYAGLQVYRYLGREQ